MIFEYRVRKINKIAGEDAQIPQHFITILVAGIFLTLNNEQFKSTFKDLHGQELFNHWWFHLNAEIDRMLVGGKNQKIKDVFEPLSGFSKLYTPNKKHINGVISSLIEFLAMERELNSSVDNFLGEIYSGDKKSLGIVLTPKYVRDLCVKMAQLSPGSSTLDISAGAGGFLISALENGASSAYGVEIQPHMWALACINLHLKGQGNSKVFLGSCFDSEISSDLKNKSCDAAFVNPPYLKRSGQELKFALNALELLKPGGLAFVILPRSCLENFSKTRGEILKAHKLIATISLPQSMFLTANVETCLMIVRAHVPHRESLSKTWLARGTSLAFCRRNKKSIAKFKDEWIATEKKLISDFLNQKETPGKSILKTLNENSSWFPEENFEVDYRHIGVAKFESSVRCYFANLIINSQVIKNEQICISK